MGWLSGGSSSYKASLKEAGYTGKKDKQQKVKGRYNGSGKDTSIKREKKQKKIDKRVAKQEKKWWQ